MKYIAKYTLTVELRPSYFEIKQPYLQSLFNYLDTIIVFVRHYKRIHHYIACFWQLIMMPFEYNINYCCPKFYNSCQRFSYKQYCGPYGHTDSIFNGIWIKQSVGMVSIFNLDKLSLKKLFLTMNI